MTEAELNEMRERLRALFFARRGGWFAHPHSQRDQDVDLVGIEDRGAVIDILVRDLLRERPLIVRLRIQKSTIAELPERFLADNLFVEMLEFIEAVNSPGLPEDIEGEAVVEYA